MVLKCGRCFVERPRPERTTKTIYVLSFAPFPNPFALRRYRLTSSPRIYKNLLISRSSSLLEDEGRSYLSYITAAAVLAATLNFFRLLLPKSHTSGASPAVPRAATRLASSDGWRRLCGSRCACAGGGRRARERRRLLSWVLFIADSRLAVEAAGDGRL